ncbi:MAG: CotH kinase family protein, partial [Balneolaceae bacterium]
GYGLSDDEEEPFRWVMPSVNITPGAHLLIWATGKDRTNTSNPLHANFAINRDGEAILLTSPDGNRIDEIPPTPIPEDNSYGRYPDGSSTFFFFDEPTPGSSNNDSGFTEFLSSPKFSHEGGQYTSAFQLTLSSAEDADIYYTRDNSIPTTENGILYTGPVTINGSYIIRARAFKEGALSSESSSHIFNMLSSNVANFNSNLPLVIINDYDSQLSPGDRTPGAITFIEAENEERVTLTAENYLQSRMVINERGSSSLALFPKKIFGFHLRDDEEDNRSEPLLGLPPEHNWILYAPYTDFTLMRNVVAYQLFEDMGWYSPRTKFVELYLHTGNGPVTNQHYHGIYVLVERIKWDQNRVDITQIEPHENEEPDISGGYIIKKDRLNPGESGFRTRRGTKLAHVRPNESDISNEQQDWIRNYMSDFEDTLYGSDFKDPQNGYEKYIDVDSFIDYFLHTELLKQIDGYRLSTFMYKDRNGKLTMGPVWDYNLSIGIADYLEGWLPQGWYYIQALNDCFVGCGIRDWYERLLQDENYKKRMQERWWELRQGVFSRDHLFGMIDFNTDLLQESQARDFQKWPRIENGKLPWPNHYKGLTRQEHISYMRDWLNQRIIWMDSQMGNKPEILLHTFWYFDDTLPNNTPLETVDASYSTGTDRPYIEFQSSLDGYPFNEDHELWRQASMERRNRPTNLNYRTVGNEGDAYDEDEMRALQVRQPFRGDGGENMLIFHIPTTDAEEIVFSFAAMDEGAADRLLIDYSVDPNSVNWVTTGLTETSLELTDQYQIYTIDFTDIQEVNDNSAFKVRIRFDGESLSQNNGDRVTFNNISLDILNPDGPGGGNGVIGGPGSFQLSYNYPNPFSDGTTIEYRIPHGTHVQLEVFDTLGRRIAVLVDGIKEAGSHRADFNGSGFSSGLYIYRITTSFDSAIGKMMLVK